MSGVFLSRSDPMRNLHRYYWLDVQPDLFGQWCVVRSWGRFGRAGQMLATPYRTQKEAQAAVAKQQNTKQRRGYKTR